MNKNLKLSGMTLACLGVLGGALLLTGCKDPDEQNNVELQQSRDKQMAGMAAGGAKPAGYDAAKGTAGAPK